MESVNVYVKNEEIDESEHDDIWDDELLIKAYNKSVSGIKQKIAQRMGVPNNGSSEDVENDETDKNVKKIQNNSVKKGQRKKKWEVGDCCRAVYSEDGLEYEAQIVEVIPHGKCVIRYLGYDNEEVVKVNKLKNSLGENSRTKQRLVGCSPPDKSDSCVPENTITSISMPPVPGVPAIPPPPAFSLTSQFHQDNESDALSAMLMSWYMSGYHTGYYQGLMQAKEQFQKTSNSKK